MNKINCPVKGELVNVAVEASNPWEENQVTNLANKKAAINQKIPKGNSQNNDLNDLLYLLIPNSILACSINLG